MIDAYFVYISTFFIYVTLSSIQMWRSPFWSFYYAMCVYQA